MGITGLLPFLGKATRPCHISEFRGATVVVDTYCWLHRSTSTCVLQLFHGNDSVAYIDYCLKYVKMLQSYDIKPILVFDGKNLPAKAKTEAKRREARNAARKKVADLLSVGKTEEARMFMKQAINVTPEMASAVIKECQKMNVDCIVAPYESDAQLAFFNLKGVAELVITEDSDLVLFGCAKVMYKLDLTGTGTLLDAEKIPEAMKMRPDQYSFDKFRHMCILSGCDYVDSLYGIGLKKAQKFISLTQETNPEIFLDKVPRYLKMHHLQITEEYKENFMLADATFRHQIIFDPYQKKLAPLMDPERCGTNPKYCKNAGEIYDHEKALQVALGNLDPVTFKKLNDWLPDFNDSSSNSIWSGVCRRSASRKLQKLEKANVKEFSISQTLTSEVENIKIQDMEDIQIKNELQFYTKKSMEPNKYTQRDLTVTQIKEIKKEEKNSPIKNIFMKKLSKFPHTDIESNGIVKSRFFFSEHRKQDVEISESDTENEISISQGIEKIERSTSEGHNSSASIICDEQSYICSETVDCEKGEIQTVSMKRFSPKKEETSAKKRKRLGPNKSCEWIKKSKSDNQQTLFKFFKTI